MRSANRADDWVARNRKLWQLISVLFLCWAGTAQARTWGTKPFENDAATAWLVDLKANGAESITHVLKQVNDEKSGQVAAETCSMAIAAASVVAAARDGLTNELDPEASAWLQSSGFKPDGKLAKQAKTAVQTCRGAGRSALYMYWMGMTNAPAWIDSVKSLLKRLED